VSSKAIIAILSKTRPIARMVLLRPSFRAANAKGEAASPPSKPMNSRRCNRKKAAILVDHLRSDPSNDGPRNWFRLLAVLIPQDLAFRL
jgi:hypothetical protein